MLEKVGEVVTTGSSGKTKRKFSEVGQDLAIGQQDAKVRKMEKGTPESGGDGTAAKDDGPGWACASCTFVNHQSLDVCEMCDNSRHAIALLQQQLEVMKQQTSIVRPPSNWQPVDPGTRMKLVKLALNDVDYLEISNRMLQHGFQSTSSIMSSVKSVFSPKTSPLYNITKIERTENLHLYQMYMIMKEQMKKENGPLVENEKRLWHGTAPECVANIASYGFNRSHCGKNGTAFGKGVYFSSGPSYSSSTRYAQPDQSGLQYMFYSRVLTGRHTIGNTSMVEPPMFTNGLGRFNSLTNRMADPNIFVVFHDAQSYPEFLVTFTIVK